MSSQMISPSRRRCAQYQILIVFTNALVGVFAVPHPPIGVRPAVFIDDVNVHEGVPCKLCREEKLHGVPQLLAPQLGYTDDRDRYCKHVYTTSREAYFCWNKNGSLHLRRVNGSGEHRYPDSSVVLYQPGEDMMDMPFSAPPSFVGEGEQRARYEAYYDMLFQFLHPYSSRRLAERYRRLSFICISFHSDSSRCVAERDRCIATDKPRVPVAVLCPNDGTDVIQSRLNAKESEDRVPQAEDDMACD